jgi:glycerophosphoryl diester phosphodiesterase
MKNTIALAVLSVVLFSCAVKHSGVPSGYPAFMKEGHRGTRGLMPENTIPAMKKGLEVGARFIEVDVYTSKDGKVIISHDYAVNADHTLDPQGKEMTKTEAAKFIFHQMNYEDIRKFDVGSMPYKPYPRQQRMKVSIPLLSDLIDSVEAFTKSRSMPGAIYNIELKNDPTYDGKLNATPSELVEATMKVVKSKNIGNRFYIQSFDFRPLQYVHKTYPKVTTGFLTNDTKSNFEANIEKLGFVPDVYSPVFTLVTPELISKTHAKNSKLVPWTVNTKEDMQRMISLGVDGIITDYPDILNELK